MNPLSKITAFMKRFGKRSGVKHLDPSRDWLILLGLSLAVLTASVAWNAWFFFIALRQESGSHAAPADKKLDTSALEKARALFEVRASEESRYRSEYHFIDPSH